MFSGILKIYTNIIYIYIYKIFVFIVMEYLDILNVPLLHGQVAYLRVLYKIDEMEKTDFSSFLAKILFLSVTKFPFLF